jgi:hypothetical protein
MKKIEDKNIYIEYSNNEENIETELLKLAKSYDLYVGAIDDGTSYRNAIANNNRIIEKLKEFGCSNLTFKDYEPMFSSKKEDWQLI